MTTKKPEIDTGDAADAAAKNTAARRMFLRWILGFFSVFIIVDGFFWYLASESHTGLVTEQPYEKGLAYNDTVAASDEQSALGWSSKIKLVSSDVVVTLTDRDGAAITGARLEVAFTRPTVEGYDFSALLRSDEDGVYKSTVEFPLDGQWDVRIFVTWNQQQYQRSTRLMVRP